MTSDNEHRLRRARVLIELDAIAEAELTIADTLDQHPECLDAISLLAKIKHIKGELSQTIACWALIHTRSVQQRAGLEQDLEQLDGLLRVHDQLGTPDALAAAARISWHVLGKLERAGVEKLSVLGQLAAIERRRGHAELAAELEARFLDLTRRRMHRPALFDVVRVAATEYLPIAKLRELRTAGDVLPLDLPRREQALVRALRGEHQLAKMLFADGTEALDRQYLAELLAFDGDEQGAIALFLETIEERPDLQIVGWLLDRRVRVPGALALLEANRQLAPQRADTWRWLAIHHELAGNADEARRCSIRADAFAQAATARAMPIGRTLAASVYRLAGRAKGLLHEIWVDRERAGPGRGGTLSAEDIHGNLTPELRAAVRNTFFAVREYARAKFPHATTDLDAFTYSYKLPKEDEPSGGLSAGLPSALAFLSVFLQRPIARTIASSGTLVSEAHDVISIGRIGEADYKVKAAYHGNLESLILPLANRADLDRSALVPLAIRNELVRYAADLDQVVKLVFGADVFTS